MNTKEAYKQKMDAELELAQAKLAEWKAHAKSSAADAGIQYGKLVDELEHGVNVTHAKLKELGEASDDAWEHVKDSVESGWHKVSTAIRDGADKFKA